MSYSKIQLETILKSLGFDNLNQMQLTTLGASKKNDNILLLAPTGSGKTLAYLLSILPKLKEKTGVQALILAPTRELVLQIESVLKKMKLPFKVNACFGGHSFSVEKRNFNPSPTIVVGTPGRIKDHLRRETFDPLSISQLIFDEFDKSLEFGFYGEMKYITNQLTNVEVKILVSATKTIEIPPYIGFENAHVIEVDSGEEDGSLLIRKMVVPKDEKLSGLVHFINNMQDGQNAIVFANHRETCNRVSEYLQKKQIVHSVFHGGLEQDSRETELVKFRNGSSQVLIATDIASRGIDVPELDFVVHYQIPGKESVFTHRNGRTARMKASGTSILILSQEDYLPGYLTEDPELVVLDEKVVREPPRFITLHVNKGKKDKVNKMDIVGFFLQFDFMTKEDVGLVEIRDFTSLVAISRNKSERLLKISQNKKIKNKAARISILE